MRPDASNDEAGARDYAQIAGRDEHIGNPVGSQDPSPWDAPDARLRPDPWEAWTCQRCGSINSDGMPAKCDGCGLRNYGEGATP